MEVESWVEKGREAFAAGNGLVFPLQAKLSVAARTERLEDGDAEQSRVNR